MASKDMIGRQLSTGTATVRPEHVAAFAHGLGDDNPAYADAGTSSHGRAGPQIASPTYPIAFMAEAMAGGANTFLELGLNFMTLVHGEQEFEYVRPIRAGESLTLSSRVADVYEKTGSSGTLDFVVLETEARDARNEPVFYSRNVLISRRA